MSQPSPAKPVAKRRLYDPPSERKPKKRRAHAPRAPPPSPACGAPLKAPVGAAGGVVGASLGAALNVLPGVCQVAAAAKPEPTQGPSYEHETALRKHIGLMEKFVFSLEEELRHVKTQLGNANEKLAAVTQQLHCTRTKLQETEARRDKWRERAIREKERRHEAVLRKNKAVQRGNEARRRKDAAYEAGVVRGRGGCATGTVRLKQPSSAQQERKALANALQEEIYQRHCLQTELEALQQRLARLTPSAPDSSAETSTVLGRPCPPHFDSPVEQFADEYTE